MYCNKCGNRLKEGDFFCAKCGNNLKDIIDRSVCAGDNEVLLYKGKTAKANVKKSVIKNVSKLAGRKVLYALICIIVAGGITGGIINNNSSDNKSSSDELSSAGLEKATDIYYGELLSEYRNAEEHGFNNEYSELINEGYELGYYSTEPLYYAAIDFANDGIPELFIYDKEYGQIYDAYGIANEDTGEVVRLFDDSVALLGDRIHCYICEGQILRLDSSGGALLNSVEYFTFEPNSATPVPIGGAAQEDYTYYYGHTDEISKMFVCEYEITENEYYEMMDKYPVDTSIEWKRLSEYENAD